MLCRQFCRTVFISFDLVLHTFPGPTQVFTREMGLEKAQDVTTLNR